MTDPALLEPSFADALTAIDRDPNLSARTRSHWCCSLRQIANAMDKPLQVIPARWTSVRFPIGRLNHARVGSTPKTLANHKSNVRAALRWFGNEHDVPARGTPLRPEWALLRERLADRHRRAILSGLMRYCSGRGIGPEEVDEAVVDSYMCYRAETTELASDPAARRAIARAWNAGMDAIEGWPARRLVEPPVKTIEGPDWLAFPEGLRTDIERYLVGLTRIRRGANGTGIFRTGPSLEPTGRGNRPGFEGNSMKAHIGTANAFDIWGCLIGATNLICGALFITVILWLATVVAV
jgi:hypothetical protein